MRGQVGVQLDHVLGGDFILGVRYGSTIVNKAIDVMHDAGCDIQIVMA